MTAVLGSPSGVVSAESQAEIRGVGGGGGGGGWVVRETSEREGDGLTETDGRNSNLR